MNRCITVLQTAPLPLGYAAAKKYWNVLKKRNQVKPQCCGTTVNLSRRSPKNKSSPHGGVLGIAQKGLYVRTTIAMVPFHRLPIDAPPGKANAAVEGGATMRIQTHVFEMLEVILFVADPMVHKPLLPTNDLLAPPWKAALPWGFKRMYSRCWR